MFSPLRAASRLTLLALWTAVCVPVYGGLRLAGRDYLRFGCGYWRGVCRLVGIEVAVRGAGAGRRPILFVANHVSYLDIAVLGSLIAGTFIAKREVAAWPLLGLVARMAGTIFIHRRSNHAASQRDQLTARLAAGEALILFPEGTSGAGNRVLPFKSALFSVAEADLAGGLAVQPVAVAYTRLDGLPIGYGWRSFFAWYGDMSLAPHVWTMLGMGRLTVEVEFLEPVSIADCRSRKTLAQHCQRVVARAVAAANAGRPAEAAGQTGDPVPPA